MCVCMCVHTHTLVLHGVLDIGQDVAAGHLENLEEFRETRPRTVYMLTVFVCDIHMNTYMLGSGSKKV